MCRAAPGKADDRGTAIKDALADTARERIAGQELKPDISNRSDRAVTPDERYTRVFGAGVVHAGDAVEWICGKSTP